jgi:cytoskeletal protein CcmA (bactofilin family)
VLGPDLRILARPRESFGCPGGYLADFNRRVFQTLRGLPLFKRRKPDDEPETMMEQNSPSLPIEPAASPGLQDTGLGVPPRPMPPIKDMPMARPPFAPQTINPPMPPSAPRPPGPPLSRLGNGRDLPGVAAERRTLVVGRGISVQGMVQEAERLVVEGTVEANMIHAAELSVSHGGVFKGEVEVEDAEIAGTVDGTVTARGNLIIRATGVVMGTARCRRLQVEDGGQITGRIEMVNEGARAAAASYES